MEYRINFIRNSFKRFWAAHRDELLAAVDRCGSAGDLILRGDVVDFENNLSRYVGTKYAIAVNSGTDALFLACKALGIGPGDEVITVAHTFIASIQCIHNVGATPVLIDVGPDELMDVSLIEAAITPKTKAIIPVHFHGKVCNMSEILRIARKYNLKVIEDACQALGSSYRGNGQELVSGRAGSFGDFGCFSFNTPKLMGGWGDGGALVTDNYELAHKVMLLRNHWNMAQTSVNMPDFPTPEVVHWAFKSRMDNIQAAMLNVKWKYYPQLLERRKEIAARYIAGLKDLEETGQFKLPTYNDGDVIQEFIIRMREGGVAGHAGNIREAFKEHMDKAGIELLIRETTPNHKVKLLGLDHFSLPVTENISTDAVRLPCYPELTNDEVDEVVEAIKDFYANR